jgi:hypothetical protein
MKKKILQKHIPKSKTQLQADNRQIEEYNRHRKIAREVIFPVIMTYATDAKNAENTINIFKSVITTMMQMPYRDMTIGGLKMDEQLTKEEKAPDRDFHMALIDALRDIKIADAMKLLDGMAGAINGYTNGLAGKKPMSEITIDDIIK